MDSTKIANLVIELAETRKALLETRVELQRERENNQSLDSKIKEIQNENSYLRQLLSDRERGKNNLHEYGDGHASTQQQIETLHSISILQQLVRNQREDQKRV